MHRNFITPFTINYLKLKIILVLICVYYHKMKVRQFMRKTNCFFQSRWITKLNLLSYINHVCQIPSDQGREKIKDPLIPCELWAFNNQSYSVYTDVICLKLCLLLDLSVFVDPLSHVGEFDTLGHKYLVSSINQKVK